MVHDKDNVDFALRRLAIQAEDEYFGDLTLRDYPGITAKLAEEYDDGGYLLHLPSVEHVALFSIGTFDDGDTTGCYYRKTKSITLATEDGGGIPYNNLLHEMIHFYIHELEGDRADESGSSRPDQSLKQYIAVKLWLKLSESVPDLDQRAQDFVELTDHDELEHKGGEHDLLFFLKSLELDVKCGYPLGTVFGYGRADTGGQDEQETED